MKSLAPAFREFARIVRRQVHRLCLLFERRKLARLETALGLLGWQQADYDSGTLEHVSRLTDCERAQARLTNESAALAMEIQQIEEQRGVAQREFAEAQAATLEKERPGVADVEALEALLAAKRKERKEIEARLPELDRDLEAAEEKYRALLAPVKPVPQAESQLLYWRKVILAAPQVKAEWTAKLTQAEDELAALEALRADLLKAQQHHEKHDKELLDEIGRCQRAKRKVEKKVDALEKVKTDPYREIGRALADHDIAPLNQPEALATVLIQRKKIAALEAAIAASLVENARE